MSQLDARDLHAALQFALQARATDSLQQFREELVPTLRRLVDGDTLGYTEIDLEQGIAFSISDAPALDGIEQRFLELADQHPLICRQRSGDLAAHMISDFLSPRAFHSLELYQDIYRPLGVEDQIAFGLPSEAILAIHLTRTERTFTDRDCQLLELIRPHLALTYRHLREQERNRALIQALESELENHNAAVIQHDSRGRVAHASGAAWELLDAYFGTKCGNRHRLPTEFGGLVDAAQPNGSPRKVAIDGPRGQLRVRAQPHAAPDRWRALILEEQRPLPPSSDALRALGLTRRQAQVLRLVVCGKPSRQIAGELQISTATVEKHLEHIYRRLGVSNRAQALARVYA